MDLQKEVANHLNKTTNTIILDYLLWLSAKTILREGSAESSSRSSHSKGRRLVGLVDGLILTFDLTNRPKFSYELLTRRLNLASLVILFVYRDSQSQYITRRSAESQSYQAYATANKARTTHFLQARGVESVLSGVEEGAILQEGLAQLEVSDEVKAQARALFGAPENAGRQVSLRDALHQFILVSASSFASGKKSPAKIWISMTIKFCLFATLEGYLLLGDRSIDCLNECFGYGTLPSPDYGHPDIDTLFEDDGKRKNRSEFGKSWETMRLETLRGLIPSHDGNLEAHLLDILQTADYEDFKEEVATYLSAVLECMPDPELCKYPSALDEHVLRAPGMISISHESDTERPAKRAKVSV